MKHLCLTVLVAALAACVMPASSSSTLAPPAAVEAGVYINGQRLTGAQEAELAQLVGEPVPAGRYVLEANGMFGFEGRSERVDLGAHIRQRQGTGAGNTGNTGNTGDGNTMMTDGRGSTMVGYGDCVSMTTPSGTFLGSGC